MPSPHSLRPQAAPTTLSRRAVLGTAAAAGAAWPLAALGASPAEAAADGYGYPGTFPASVRAATTFLQRATDAYGASGDRLVQSFSDASGLGDVAFTYDNALTAMALLVSGDVVRARAIGDGLVHAQQEDANYDDFRLRQAYRAAASAGGHWVPLPAANFGLTGTAVGDMAWAGLALAQLAYRTRQQTYLSAALQIGRWIVKNTYSGSGLGGYTFGETAGLTDHKSTEHNVDVYGLFRLLAQLSADAAWTARARHAWDFVAAVWNAQDRFFWTGSNNGADINKLGTQLPEDVQSWSWLAARSRHYGSALDWAAANLATTDTPLRANTALRGNVQVTGVAFSSGGILADPGVNIGGQAWNPKPDNGAVWLEGTAHLALALRDRNASGDKAAALRLLGEIKSSQQHLGQGQTLGQGPTTGGIVAASSPLETGFGFGYFPNVHIGATSWYVLAASNANPYRFF